jgi:hypothetical protein
MEIYRDREFGRLMEVKSFDDLEVWQIGRDLVTKVYMLTVSLPQSETFGLIAQIERAALSVPANIAEGLVVIIIWIRPNFISTLGALSMN